MHYGDRSPRDSTTDERNSYQRMRLRHKDHVWSAASNYFPEKLDAPQHECRFCSTSHNPLDPKRQPFLLNVSNLRSHYGHIIIETRQTTRQFVAIRRYSTGIRQKLQCKDHYSHFSPSLRSPVHPSPR